MNAHRNTALAVFVAAFGLALEQAVREQPEERPEDFQLYRGPWRRMGGGRGPVGRGAGRGRGHHRRTGDAGFLLDYANGTHARTSEAAFVDSRTGEFARTVGLNDPSLASNIIDSPNALDSVDWTQNNGLTTTPDTTVAPDGTTTADTLDDSSGLYSFASQTLTVSNVTEYRLSFWVKKDADVSRFVGFSAGGFSGTIEVHVNTATGEHVVVSGAPRVYISEAVAGWWRVVLTATTSTTTSIVRVYPARATVIGTSLNTATGSAIFWGVTFEETGGVGITPWALDDEARIFSDGAIYIEETRTNKVTESSDLSAWNSTGAVTETGAQVAPDGSPSAWRIEDTDAATTSRWYIDTGALNTGSHAESVFILKDSDTSRFPEIQALGVGATITGGTVGIQLNTSTGATSTRVGSPDFVRVTDAGDWWRVEFGFTVSVGGTARVQVYPSVTDSIGTVNVAATGAVTAWGAQLEEGEFASSPIRTAGGTATRVEDHHQHAGDTWDALRDQQPAVQWDVWPDFDFSDPAVGGDLSYVLDGQLSTTFAAFRYTGAAWQTRFGNDAGGTNVNLSNDWNAHDKLRFTVNHVTGVQTLENVTQDTVSVSVPGASAGGSWTSEGSNVLTIGSREASTNHLNGIVGRPRAA